MIAPLAMALRNVRRGRAALKASNPWMAEAHWGCAWDWLLQYGFPSARLTAHNRRRMAMVIRIVDALKVDTVLALRGRRLAS